MFYLFNWILFINLQENPLMQKYRKYSGGSQTFDHCIYPKQSIYLHIVHLYAINLFPQTIHQCSCPPPQVIHLGFFFT